MCRKTDCFIHAALIGASLLSSIPGTANSILPVPIPVCLPSSGDFDDIFCNLFNHGLSEKGR